MNFTFGSKISLAKPSGARREHYRNHSTASLLLPAKVGEQHGPNGPSGVLQNELKLSAEN